MGKTPRVESEAVQQVETARQDLSSRRPSNRQLDSLQRLRTQQRSNRTTKNPV